MFTQERIGRAAGVQEGVQQGIARGLELKFGESGTALLPEIRQITEPSVLQAIIARIKTATAPDEIRAVYTPGQ